MKEWENMYQQPRKYRAMCPDGRIRTATETGEAGVWFAVNARIAYRGKTVSGAVTAYSDVATDDNGNIWPEDLPSRTDATTGESTIWDFRPYTYRRNGHVFD